MFPWKVTLDRFDYVMKELYMSFENEQYEYINEGYGSVEMYAICKVLWKSEF
jgi:hypothetical protein